MVAAASATAAGGAAKPPATIEDFLWNLHSVLVAAPAPLHLESLKDVYTKQTGHKCAIERFLVVGDGGLAATLKRIPHIVTFYQERGAQCIKATNAATLTKQELIGVDQAYRAELQKKSQQAKANAKAASAPTAAKSGTTAASAPAGAGPDGRNRKPATVPAGDNDTDQVSKMLAQGVVRVLQNRAKAGKGPLCISELEEEFKALWKVPFNLQQAGESDPVAFLRKWPHKLDVEQDAEGKHIVSLKAGDKPKAATASQAPQATPTPAKSGAIAEDAKQAPGKVEAAAASSEPAATQTSTGSTKPPTSIEDFLWNMHQLALTHEGNLPIEEMKDAYLEYHGHKCTIERFLVVGDGGLVGTLKRIPHVITLITGKDGGTTIRATQSRSTTRDLLIAADQAYRRQLQAKHAANKAKTAAPGAVGPCTAAASNAQASSAAAPQKRTAAEEPDAGEAKKPKCDDDRRTLSKMLVQGVAKVLQHRAEDSRGPLPLSKVEEEFTAMWDVPFKIEQAGDVDTVAFLKRFPGKFEIVHDGEQHVVRMSKKLAAKVARLQTNAALGEVPRTMLELRTYAAEQLKAMRELMQKQEAFVNALNSMDD